MRYLLILPLLALCAVRAAAEEKDAEKLYRAMEQKLRAAKTVQIRCDISLTDAILATKLNLKATLILGEGDKFRGDFDGKVFGETLTGKVVSDGTQMKIFGRTGERQENKTEKTPKGIGAYFRRTLAYEGFYLSSLNEEQRRGQPPNAFKLSDFRLAGQEKIGARNTHVIEYTDGEKDKDPLAMKWWLDEQTHLPVKLAMSWGKSDILDIIESYTEFTIDAKVDAKTFELPK